MITIDTNMHEVITSISDKLNGIDGQRICMMQATWLVGELRKRIHVEGKASDGSQIGAYSSGYMKVRTGDFGNRPTAKKWKNKGQPRPRYNRTNDPKIILSLTRQMEDGMKVFPLENGAGIGWDNDLDFKKSQWVEETYGKEVYQLTADELEGAMNVANVEINRILS